MAGVKKKVSKNKNKDEVSVKKENLPQYEKTQKSRDYIIAEGAANTAMEGFGKSYILAFAVALKASNTMLGAIASLPELLGSVFQLASIRFSEVIKSRKMFIALLSFLQALVWIPLLLIPFIQKTQGPVLVLVLVSVFSVLAYLMSPIWNSLMGDIIPEDTRGSYFGKRNAITGLTAFISTFIAGLILNWFELNPFIGFAILFGLAFLSKLICVYYFTKIYEPKYTPSTKSSDYFSFFDFIKRMKRSDNNYGHFVLYIVLINFVVYIASPFYTAYMLNDLHFSYSVFMLITIASVLGSFLAMFLWGKFIDKHGNKKVLYICGLLLPLASLPWVFFKTPITLFIFEFIGGIIWAGFNLASANFIFDATTPEKRVRCVSYFKLLTGIAIFGGAMIGGVLATNLGKWIFISSLPILFLITSVGRLVVSLIFLPQFKEMRLIDVPVGHSFFKAHLEIKPSQGVVYQTIGSYKKKDHTVHHTNLDHPPELIKKAIKTAKESQNAEKERRNKQLLRFVDGQKKK